MNATNDQIVRFFRSHDPEKLLQQGIMEIDADHTDLEDALLSESLPATVRQGQYPFAPISQTSIGRISPTQISTVTHSRPYLDHERETRGPWK